MLDQNVLLLMGISNGVYVGAKWAVTGDPVSLLLKREAVIAVEILDFENSVNELTDPETKQAKAGSEQEFKMLQEKIEAKKKERDAIKTDINK